MNVISNRELHLRKFERRQQVRIKAGPYAKQQADTAVIVDFHGYTGKRKPDVRVRAL
ncbi:hypothetical protein UYO_0832 [Lachnospiraceae bacterium JC7]|nr:hypothetical protein UYO_0832 [Lachnospiraceae bacterium JC7]